MTGLQIAVATGCVELREVRTKVRTNRRSFCPNLLDWAAGKFCSLRNVLDICQFRQSMNEGLPVSVQEHAGINAFLEQWVSELSTIALVHCFVLAGEESAGEEAGKVLSPSQ